MKRSRNITMSLALGFALPFLMALPAMAEPAIVYQREGPCGMPGSDADGHIMFGGLGVATLYVLNDERVTLICHGDDITNLSGIAQVFDGWRCGIGLESGAVFSTDTHATIAPNGVAMSRCSYRFGEPSS